MRGILFSNFASCEPLNPFNHALKTKGNSFQWKHLICGDKVQNTSHNNNEAAFMRSSTSNNKASAQFNKVHDRLSKQTNTFSFHPNTQTK